MSAAAGSGRALAWAGVVGAVSLLAGFAAVVFGGEVRDVHSAGADAFSSSAIGHRALVELLRERGREVVLSRRRGPGQLEPEALLLLLEPGGELDEQERTARIERALAEHPNVLVALPKRTGLPGMRNPGWLGTADLVPVGEVEGVLAALGARGSVERLDEPASSWASADLPYEPDLAQPQLVRSPDLETVVRSGESLLVGRLTRSGGPRHYVLADPDLLANHGLGDGQNAAFVVWLLDELAGPDAPIVIDEVIHGHAIEPRIWAELGRFPLVLVLIQVALVLVFLAWAGARRFGPAEAEPEGLRAGKRLLIDNTAGLLMSGGYSGSLLGRYLEQNERHVAARYHLPPDLPAGERRARLAALRSGGPGLEETRAAVVAARRRSEPDQLEAARLVRRWREELLHGDR